MRTRQTTICLINSNIPYKYELGEVEIIDFQTGLLSLASVLEKHNYKVRLVDLAWLVRQERLTIDDSYHNKVAKLIIEQDIPILGFNTRCDTYPSVLNIAKRCKELNPKSTIILGGPQATFTDLDTLKEFPFVDVVVRGEGELTLLDLVNHIKDKKGLSEVPGITCRHNGQIIRNRQRELIRDLDSLPLPAYHLIENVETKNIFKKHRAYISVGRGCPYKCSFCASSLMDRQCYRMRRPQNILKEIMFLKREYGVDRFNLGHDHFLVNRKIAKEICNSLIDNKLNIQWNCFSRIEAIDSNLLRLLVRAGCEEISFGIESGSERMQKIIGKNLRLELVPKVIGECYKYNISTVTSFIVGFPEEELEDLDATLRLALKCHEFPTNVLHHHLLSPMSGTLVCQQNIDRLIYLDWWSDMVSGPITCLQENVSLIKKYPNIFSAFYMIKPKYLPPNLPYEIATNFFNIIVCYPKSFQIAISELKFSPTKLLEKWGEWTKTRGLKLRYFPVFLKSVYRQKRADFKSLREIAELEKKCLWQQTKITQYLKDLRKSIKHI